MQRNLLLSILFTSIIHHPGFAQTISGKITDERNQPIPAVVCAFSNSTLKGGDVGDIDGNYSIKPLPAGMYTLLVVYPSYDSQYFHAFRNPELCTAILLRI